jgi:hypothetical protein
MITIVIHRSWSGTPVGLKFLTTVFGPDDVVVEDYPEHKQSLATALVDEWRPLQGTWRPRAWGMHKDGHGRTKQLELEGYYGQPPRLQTLKKPGGGVDIFVDSYFRMKLTDLAEEPSPKTPPKQKRKRRSRQPTAAELNGLAAGRETMRQRRKQDREEASAASRLESSSAIHEDSAVS